MKRHIAVGVVITCLVAAGGVIWLGVLRRARAPASDSGPSAAASAGVGAVLPEPALPKPEGVTEGGLTGQEGTRESEAPPQEPAQTVAEPQTAPQAVPKLAWEDRITRVTEDLGLTADISDCKVIVDGKPLEGKKVLAAVSAELFVNECRVHPPLKKGLRTNVMYSCALTEEALLIFREFLRREPGDPDAAMERATVFAGSMPWVNKVERANWEILVYYDPALLEIVLVGAHFDTGPDPSGPETRHLRERRERGIVDRFYKILKGLDRGATLAVDTEKGYQLQD